MKLKEIHRTSTFAWSPTPSLPILATGTVAGALDESFSNESKLEIWAPDFLDKDEFDLGGDEQHGPKGVIQDTARFNRLAWGNVVGSRPRGVLAAGMENGELTLWDPDKIISGVDASESLVLRNTLHTGPIRGLDFNPIQTSLLSSGAVNGEVYIWDLKDPGKPYSPTPGSRSTKLDEITSVAWNQQVPSVLAGASTTGYTVVWDLRGKREVVALAYGGGTGTMAGPGGAMGGLAVGGRRGMSAIAWHPDNATRLVTASEDDTSPIIMVWDLRNARAPEKILTGHEKGVLSLSWCKQDADLLLSCGKDNRVLCWNPQTSEIIGELPSADNWAFQVEWCPRNPDLLAAAFFDGTIGLHSIQSTNESAGISDVPLRPDGADIFDVPGFSRSSQGTLSLKQPPKWLRRPITSSFGFGGRLVTVTNVHSAQGKSQNSVVRLRKIVTETDVVKRAIRLQSAIEGQTLKDFAEDLRGQDRQTDGVSWKAILSLFKADSRDELVTLLGFSKTEIAARVAEAVEHLKAIAAETSNMKTATGEDIVGGKPVVSFAEPESQGVFSYNSDVDVDDLNPNAAVEQTPSEVSASAISDAMSAARLADGESTTTASLFGDENAAGAPQGDTGADFFSTIGIGQTGSDETQHILVPHHNYGLDSSVAATIGSGPSSVTSETLKSIPFRIYPADESETDQLITKALVLGDFQSAVALCLSTDRFADAILLAVKGGPELLLRTQRAYFERRTSLPYVRLFQSIVTNDLADIVRNADLHDWQEIFVVLCTFATLDEFSSLVEQLGNRLEFQSTLLISSNEPDAPSRAYEYRRNATLTYLAAGRLERLVSIWAEELTEEEKHLVSDEKHLKDSWFTAHAHALQSFIEKVAVFTSAIDYKDADLLAPPPSDDASAKTYKLACLYDRYFEYADLLASQGLLREALTYLQLAPPGYKGSTSKSPINFGDVRDRLSVAVGVPPPIAPATSAGGAPAPATGPSYQYVDLSKQGAVVSQSHISQSSSAYAPVSTANVPPSHQSYMPDQPVAFSQQPQYRPTDSAYGAYVPPVSLAQPPHFQNRQPTAGPAVMQPPQFTNNPSVPISTAPPPPPKRQENGGWNDAPPPPMSKDRRTPASLPANKPAAITTPFPNAAPATPGTPSLSGGGSPYMAPPTALPPPPRPGSGQARPPMPPPPQAARTQGPPHNLVGPYPPQGGGPPRPPSRPQSFPPPARLMSPPQIQGQVGQLPPGQYAPPPSRGPIPGQTPPPAPHARGTAAPVPPPQSLVSGAPGPYARTSSPMGQPAPYNRSQSPSSHVSYGPQNIPRTGPPQLPPGGTVHPPGTTRIGPPPGQSITPAPHVQRGPPPKKYPPGDRSHIPDSARPVYNILSEHLTHLRQTTPPQQQRLVDDLERRLNPLFDALNYETLSKPVVDQLLVLTRAMESHDRQAALEIHVDLLTRGSQTDDIGLWMSAIKQLIMRM